MEWKDPFNQSITAFKAKKYEQALKYVNQVKQFYHHFLHFLD